MGGDDSVNYCQCQHLQSKGSIEDKSYVGPTQRLTRKFFWGRSPAPYMGLVVRHR
jgi:hypothetical protein